MHFQRVILENLGPFRGVQEADFSLSRGKNVNVVCGGRGSGVTSLHRAIEWALTGVILDSVTNYFRHNMVHDTAIRDGADELSGANASVTLRFNLLNKDYEVSRRLVSVSGPLAQDDVTLSVRSDVLGHWSQIDNPQEHLRTLIPLKLFSIIFPNGEYLSDSYPMSFNSFPGFEVFREWVGDRIVGGQVPDLGTSQTIWYKLLYSMLGLAPKLIPPYLKSDQLQLAGLQLMSLYREWLCVAESLPSDISHLRGHYLPWVLDNPWHAMDLFATDQATRLTIETSAQVIIVANPRHLQGAAASFLEPRLTQLHVIRTGEKYFTRNTVKILGRDLFLSRFDGKSYSDLIAAPNR